MVLLKPLKVRTAVEVVVMVPAVQVKTPLTVMLPVPVSVPLPEIAKLDIVIAAMLVVRSLFNTTLLLVSSVTPPEYTCVPVVLTP